MNNIFYIVTNDKYPEGDAGSVRVHSFAKIFQKLGYTPIVIGLGVVTNFKLKEYDGIYYYSLRYSSSNIWGRIAGLIFFKNNVRKIFYRHGLEKIKGIMYVSGGMSVLNYIKGIYRKQNIALYYDSVEWFSPSEFKNGKRNTYYRFNNNLNTIYIDSSFKVFSISTFLKNHFLSRGINTLRVPVIMDVEAIKREKEISDQYVKIMYAGQMGTKDKISYFILALSKLKTEELRCIQMYIIGITLEQYEMEFGPISDGLKNKHVFFMGRIPRAEVTEYLSKANFTMLLRPEDERYAKAGFPTKIVESLALSTPIICNHTSDLKYYLNDMKNSVIVKGCSIDACVEGLQRAIAIKKETQLIMQKNARETAERYFDYRRYVEAIEQFL